MSELRFIFNWLFPGNNLSARLDRYVWAVRNPRIPTALVKVVS